MESKRLSQREILKELESRLESDFSYDSGRIVGSMCTRPHPLASKVHSRFLDKNLGDSGLFPAVANLEAEVVQMIGKMLSNPKASGHIVTGGTEANIMALWAAKRMAKKNHCEIVIPNSAHYSLDKAANLLGLKAVKAKLNSKFQVDLEAVRNAINQNTIALVGIAGTTGLGVVDQIAELSEIAIEKSLYLHVDAAFGGFVLPFLRQLGYDVPKFDFALPGVCSITTDPHKMGLAPIPAGGILFRNEELERKVSWKIPYMSGGETVQATLVGTRSGASAIAVWALMKYLGKEGYQKIVKRCMDLTWKIADRIPKIKDLDVVTEPTMNIVGITSRRHYVNLIAQELRNRRWAISLFPDHIRVVIMPHVQEQHVNHFLKDLSNVVHDLNVRTENNTQ